MKKTEINISLFILLLITISCCVKKTDDGEIVTVFDKKSNSIEKGFVVKGKREGFWVVFDTNYNIKYDMQFKGGIENGKTTQYFDHSIAIEAENINGIRNGKYVQYHKYPIKYTEGSVKMGKPVGEWRIYTKNGELNRIIVYEKDTFRIILDNYLNDSDYNE